MKWFYYLGLHLLHTLTTLITFCSPSKSFVLIDFGSAADIDPVKTKNFLSFTEKRIGLEDDSIVAISPIYAAPEIFVKLDRLVSNPIRMCRRRYLLLTIRKLTKLQFIC